MRLTEPTAFVSRDALRHNVRLVRDRVSPAELLAVVKDDAYGHGSDAVVDVLAEEGVTRFGTLDLPGALALRRRLPGVMVFAWVFDSGDDLADAVRAGIDLGVTDEVVLERVAAAAEITGVQPSIHLKLDTGLHRAGVLASGWERFVARATALERAGVFKVAGLWTHLAEETDDDDSRSIAEHQDGVAVAVAHGVRDPIVHVAASAASYARADARFDLVRVGAFLYGIAPGGGVGPVDLGLRPVMTLQAPISQVRQANGRMVAEVPIGGATGILSDAAGSVTVAVGGSRAPVIAVEPGYSLIDVTEASAGPGDTVTLFGDGSAGEPTLQEWADAMGTIGEEIVTRLAVTIPRIFTGR